MIEVIGKQTPLKYEIVCTDKSCRNILRFDFDDVGPVNNSVMGRTTKTTQGISCPDCRQILPVSEATVISGGKSDE